MPVTLRIGLDLDIHEFCRAAWAALWAFVSQTSHSHLVHELQVLHRCVNCEDGFASPPSVFRDKICIESQ